MIVHDQEIDRGAGARMVAISAVGSRTFEVSLGRVG
jgi:hypothetical protein